MREGLGEGCSFVASAASAANDQNLWPDSKTAEAAGEPRGRNYDGVLANSSRVGVGTIRSSAECLDERLGEHPSFA